MIIIPIGHDKLFRRLPYLTIALISLTVIIWIITYPIELKQIKTINTLYETEVYEKEIEFLSQYAQEHPEELNDLDFRNKFFEALQNGDIVDKESEEYKDWEVSYKKFKDALENRVFYRFGFKPKNISFLSLITSLFLHGSFLHLAFNMLFLWLVGVNIEDYWGRPLFISLYLIGGILAALFYALLNKGSSIPLIGASGAISALMGTFAIRFYKTKIRFFYFFMILFRPFWGTFRLFAWFALGFWFAEQLFYAMITKGVTTGVAFFAHVGGFIFGLAAGFGMKFLKVEEKFLSGKIEKQIEIVSLNPKLEDAFTKRDNGDAEGAISLLREVIKEEPLNSDARLELARSLFFLDKKNEASIEYETLLSQLYEKGERDRLLNIYLEVYEKNIDYLFSPKTQFRIGSFLASKEDYKKAVELLSLIVKHYPEDKLAPAALLKAGRIFLQKLEEVSLGKGALEFLTKNYPDYSETAEARYLLSEYKD